MTKKLVALMFVALFGGALAACNTMEGVGEDTQRAGQKLENAAERNR